MQADKEEALQINRALDEWAREGLLTEEKAEELRKSIVPVGNQGQQLAQYLLIIALSCAVLGIAALLIDEKLLEHFRRNFLLSQYSIAGVSALLATLCFWYTHRRGSKINELSRELNMLLAATFMLISITYFCKVWGNGPGYTALIGSTSICFLALSLFIRSRVLWLGFLLAFMGWFGVFSSIHEHEGLFIGLNYPLRFTLFGVLILLLSLFQNYLRNLRSLKSITVQVGLLIFFTGLWGVALFGNTPTLEIWQRLRQTVILPYAIGCGVLTSILLFLGIRREWPVLRDFSLLFLLLQLYTHYFSYFWDSLNKGLFFLLLAVSLGLLARWLRHRAEIK